MIGLANYNPNVAMNGFGIGSAGEVADLEKALTAGYQVSSQTGGSALRVESLEGSLKVVSYTAHHIKFWKKIPKSPAYSTVEEYNQVTSYGSNSFAFVQEGELPPTQDSTYARRTALVKYIGCTREVSHPMTVVHPAHGDVIAQSNHEGILWLLGQIEKALFKGDSTMAFSGQSEQWDGLETQIDATSVLDLQGLPVVEADVEEASNLLVEQFAYPTDMWLGTRVASDLVKNFYPRERVQLPAPQGGMVGMSVNSVMTQAGVLELNPNVFLTRAPTPPSAATSTNSPNTPQAASASVNTGVTTGNFNKGATAGDSNYYSYVFTAANRFGESAPSPVMANGVQFTQANKDALRAMDVVLTNAAVIGPFPPEYFRVYRTNAQATNASVTDLSQYSLIAQVAATTQGAGGTQTFRDNNLYLPFTEVAYIGEMTPQVLTLRQLLPMMRLDLAVLAPAYRWLILLYATPILFAPKKFIKLINIGRLATASS